MEYEVILILVGALVMVPKGSEGILEELEIRDYLNFSIVKIGLNT